MLSTGIRWLNFQCSASILTILGKLEIHILPFSPRMFIAFCVSSFMFYHPAPFFASKATCIYYTVYLIWLACSQGSSQRRVEDVFADPTGGNEAVEDAGGSGGVFFIVPFPAENRLKSE